MPDGNFIDVAGDDPVHQAGGIFAADHVFEKRTDVDEGGRIAYGVVLMLVVSFVNADGVISRPLAIVEALAERESALVKCGSDRQRTLLCDGEKRWCRKV